MRQVTPADVENLKAALAAWPQIMAEFSETAARAAAQIAVFAARMNGKRATVVTGSDGVSRVRVTDSVARKASQR